MDITPATCDCLRRALRDLLAPYADSGLVGISCIARGADSVFADAVLDAGGGLCVILPCQNYRQTKVKADHAPTFDRLLAAADDVVIMPHTTANREAYAAANRALLERADRLVAVWDGTPPSGKGGGTADTVEDARRAGLPVDIVWPDGTKRGQ
ncbi:hypothetical protein ADK43_06065 [Streptomyces rimosus subsp. rimosus]|nr:hypothetical protein ADK43_06065 [Streptomyces rimosus subsp. rimosus]